MKLTSKRALELLDGKVPATNKDIRKLNKALMKAMHKEAFNDPTKFTFRTHRTLQ